MVFQKVAFEQLRLTFVSTAVALLFASTALAGTYTVGPPESGCQSDGPGTPGNAPYCSIEEALDDHHQPGDVIVVQSGVYREQVDITWSGITLMGASGASAVIDGSEDFSDAPWQPETFPVFSTEFADPPSDSAAAYVIVDGIRCLNDATSSLGALPSGTYRYTNGRLYLNIGNPASPNPSDHTVLVVDRDYGVNVSASNVTVSGIMVCRAQKTCIQIKGIPGSPVQSCTVSNCIVFDSGKRGIALVAVDGFVIEGNLAYGNARDGISLNDVSNGTVTNNESHHNDHPYYARGGVNGFRIGDNLAVNTTNVTIASNRAHHNEDTGFDYHGASNCTSQQNLSWSNNDHGYDHSNSSGTSHIGDVSWGNAHDGMSIERNSPNTRLYDCIFANNALERSIKSRELFADTTYSGDYNIFYNTSVDVNYPLIKWRNGSGVQHSYVTLASFVAAQSEEHASKQADPSFADPLTGNFQLMSGSPAIDCGISGMAGWPLLDALGRTRKDDPTIPNAGAGTITHADRGAIEYQPPGTIDVGDDAKVGAPISLGVRVGRNASARTNTLGLSLGESRVVRLDVIDIAGRVALVICPGVHLAPGNYEYRVSSELPAGVYLARLRTGRETMVERIVQLR